MILSLDDSRISKWQRIASFTALKNYPILNCPYCGEEQLQFDLSTIGAMPITKPMADSFNRTYRQAKQDLEKPSISLDSLKGAPGLIAIVGAGLIFLETMAKQNHALHGIPHLMAGFLKCLGCSGSVSASGMQIIPEGNQVNSESNLIKVEHFYPTIPIIPVSMNVPEPIRNELLDAFKHFHFDPPSSASKLRRAIEQYCIDKKAVGKNLHIQISYLKANNPEIADYLEPLKLLGNEGTHSSDVLEIDLLHAFEVFQFVLENYDRDARYVETKANYEQLMQKFAVKLDVPRLEGKTDTAIVLHAQKTISLS